MMIFCLMYLVRAQAMTSRSIGLKARIRSIDRKCVITTHTVGLESAHKVEGSQSQLVLSGAWE